VVLRERGLRSRTIWRMPLDSELEDTFEIARRARRRLGVRQSRKGISDDPFASVFAQRIMVFRSWEVAQTEEVHLQQPHRLHVFHEVLGDYLPSLLRCSGTSSSSGSAAINHPRQ